MSPWVLVQHESFSEDRRAQGIHARKSRRFKRQSRHFRATTMLTAAALMAPQAESCSASWEIRDTIGNTDDDNARARRLAHMLEFNAAAPPPRRRLLALPRDEAPGQAQVRLPYIAAACFTWAALVLHDTAAALFVDEWILRPSCIQRTWARLLQLGMPMMEMAV